MNVLTIQNLSKSFGKQKIIDHLNLSVPKGSIFGFIGKNGAGKTTTMKMVLGLLQPDNGKFMFVMSLSVSGRRKQINISDICRTFRNSITI